MFTKLSIICCLAFVLTHCKKNNDESDVYIFGGEAVSAQDDLFFANASIGKIDSSGKSYPSFCSGVLITDRTILTTAACFDKSEKQVFAHFGNQAIAYAKAFVLHTEPVEVQNIGSFQPGLALLHFDKAFESPAKPAEWLEEGTHIDTGKGKFWIYALGQNTEGVYGELRRFSTNLKSKNDGYEANGTLATGDDGAGLFAETPNGKRLLGIVPPPAQKLDNTQFIDIRKYRSWVDCAGANLQAYASFESTLPSECPVLEVYGLEAGLTTPAL